MRFRALIVLTVSLVTIVPSLSSNGLTADRWPEWRGPDGQGRAAASNVPVRWSETENILWQRPIPGRGWSTPVIDQGQVWVTTGIDQLADEQRAAERRKTSTNSQPLRVSDRVSLRAVGLSLNSGEVLRDIEILAVDEPQMIHVTNSYATPTPIISEGRLYCHFGACGTGCLDTKTGQVLWTNRELVVKHENGPGSTPVLWNGLLLIHCDGIDEQYVVALDAQTGSIVWKTRRSGELRQDPQTHKAYATPLVVEYESGPQLISPAADWLYSYDPNTGRELWKLSYGTLGFSNAPRPVAGHGLVYTCTGFLKSQLLAVRLVDGEPQLEWSYGRQVPSVSSPLVVGHEIFFVADRGIATCLDAITGKVHWTERIGKDFWASPVYADGKIYFWDRSGTTTVVAASKSFQKLAVNKLPAAFYASAAPIQGGLIVRTEDGVYRIGKSPAQSN